MLGCFDSECVLSCKQNWEQNGTQCYFWSRKKKNWDDAEKTCVALGGHLASITSKAINKYILEGIFSRNIDYLYVGGTDRGLEGSWKWTDCTDWNFTNWEENEPSNKRDHDCLSLQPPTSNKPSWNDELCTYEDWFLCSRQLCQGKHNSNPAN